MAKIVSMPWSNINCESDIVNTLVWSRWILRILGIWPLIYPHTTMIEKCLAIIIFALCWTLLGFLLVSMTVYSFSEQNVVSERVRMLGPLGYVFISMLKYLFLVIRHRNIRQSIHVLSTDWRVIQQEYHRDIMINDATKGHTLSKYCVVFMYSGGLFYNAVMPFLSQISNGEQNVTVRPLPYFGYDIIVDLSYMPAYVLVFCAQCCTSLVMLSISVALCCLAAMLVSHACGQIGIVIARVETFVKYIQSNHVRSKQHMAIIVKHHVQALRFSANIEDILCEACLVEIVGSTLIICFLEYYCLMAWNKRDGIAILTYFCLLVSFIFNIFIFCYIGELLTDQCKKVGYTSYKVEWYHLPGKITLDLMFMISMSHHPIQITAGKLISLSFSSFGNVLRTSVAYLNLLRTLL